MRRLVLLLTVMAAGLLMANPRATLAQQRARPPELQRQEQAQQEAQGRGTLATEGDNESGIWRHGAYPDGQQAGSE